MDNKPLGPDEITTIQQHTGGNFIRENSVHARRIGANGLVIKLNLKTEQEYTKNIQQI